MSRHQWLTCIAVCILLGPVTGCATAPPVGLRAGFRHAHVRRVAIVPFYAVDSFGLSPAAHRAQIRTYQNAAHQWLTSHGFAVVSGRAFSQALTQNGAWQRFEDGVTLDRSLATYFEPSGSAPLPLEVATLRQLAAARLLPTNDLFFGEIVYQTRGVCRVNPRRYVKYAVVVGPATAGHPRRCVVSHFQAKLVDATSGRTMWYDRGFREVHAGRVTDAMEKANIRAVVAATLGGTHGLAPLAADSRAPRKTK